MAGMRQMKKKVAKKNKPKPTSGIGVLSAQGKGEQLDPKIQNRIRS